jgi:hypothetical protein
MHLHYLQSFRPQHAVTLQPCAHPAAVQQQRRACRWSPYGACRSGLTQFSGGFSVSFRRAPHEGRCATLRIWVGGRARPITARPFTRGDCRSDPRNVSAVCFTPAALRVLAGEALSPASRPRKLFRIVHLAFAPSLRAELRGWPGSGVDGANEVVRAALDGLEAVKQNPGLLLNASQLRNAFGRAQQLAVRTGFATADCRF